MQDDAYGAGTLPAGIRSRMVPGVNGITVHVLEAGFEQRKADDALTGQRPCVLLLHGFPELAYSWRKVMMPLAEAGYYVVAPDHRGYGRTDGTGVTFDDDLAPFTLLAHVRDTLALVYALGYQSVATVAGHDFGSPVAAWCALTRPDVFRSVVLMSAPFDGPPTLPFATAAPTSAADAGGTDSARFPQPSAPAATIHDELAALPVPRKHYHWYYATRPANEDIWHPKQGVHDFLRAYYHMKSADWAGNNPHPLAAWTAPEVAKLPRYYVMDLDQNMAESVAPEMPSAEQIAACAWLPDDELRVYSTEYGRTGFQGGLQSYRIGTDPTFAEELRLFAGRTIDVPACFIGGTRDWGVHQRPGRLEQMQHAACTQFRGVHLVDGAGHWVQQEQPEAVSRLLLEFLREQPAPTA